MVVDLIMKKCFQFFLEVFELLQFLKKNIPTFLLRVIKSSLKENELKTKVFSFETKLEWDVGISFCKVITTKV